MTIEVVVLVKVYFWSANRCFLEVTFGVRGHRRRTLGDPRLRFEAWAMAMEAVVDLISAAFLIFAPLLK